jgi:hypothetical protein
MRVLTWSLVAEVLGYAVLFTLLQVKEPWPVLLNAVFWLDS